MVCKRKKSDFSKLQVVQWGAAWIDTLFRYPPTSRDHHAHPAAADTACAASLTNVNCHLISCKH